LAVVVIVPEMEAGDVAGEAARSIADKSTRDKPKTGRRMARKEELMGDKKSRRRPGRSFAYRRGENSKLSKMGGEDEGKNRRCPARWVEFAVHVL
jgi:hypothetical protein